MIETIANALLPILFVTGLGWLAARTGLIPRQAAGNFAAFVVNFALPLSLFLAAATAKPANFTNTAFIGTLAVGLIGTFVLAVVLGRVLFGNDLQAATIEGLGCSFPNMAYCGPPVLGAVVGPTGLLAVLIGNLIMSLVLLPLSLVLLHQRRDPGSAARSSAPAPGQFAVVGTSLLNAVRQPLVWLPVLGVACAMCGIRLPTLVSSTTSEIGSAAGGVALFTLGLMLQGQAVRLDAEILANVAIKNVLQPALLVGAGLCLGLHGALLKEAFLLGVLPSATLIPALAHNEKAYETQAPPTSMISTLSSVVTISAGVAIARSLL